MPATITSQFRKNNAKNLIANASLSGQSYWIGIGKSDAWAVNDTAQEVPASSSGYSSNVLRNLITLKKASTSGLMPQLMIPSNQHETTRIYKAYDSMDDQCFVYTSVSGVTHYPCYVTAGDKVYLCLRSPLSASSTAPTGTTVGAVESSGVSPAIYSWTYLYTATGNLNTTAFKPLPTDPAVTGNSDTKGRVYSSKLFVAYGGTGYTTPTTANFHYNITNNSGVTSMSTMAINITSTIVAGVITAANIDLGSLTNIINLTQISDVSITVTNGSGSLAQLVPTVTPLLGITDLSAILPCWYVAFFAKLDPDPAADGLDLPGVNDYRQISLIQNPVFATSPTLGADSTVNSMDCLKYFVVTTAGSTLTATNSNDLILQECSSNGTISATNNAEAYIDYVILSGTGARVYFHQNYGINIKNFSASSGYIKINATVYAYSAIGVPEYSTNSGQVLFVENRASITRNPNQSEEIKLIVQL